MNGVCNGNFFFAPPPGALGRGQKVKYHLIYINKFQLQSQFQRFFNQTFCVFSHMKDIKHIYQTGFSFGRLGHAPGVRTYGYHWGFEGSKFFFRNSTRFGVWVSYMNGTCTGIIFWVPAPWGLGEGPKDQISLNIIKFQLQSQFQRFLNLTLCVFLQMKDI